jgi:hypothetical protein
MTGELASAGAVVALVDSRLRANPLASVATGLVAARVVQAVLVFASATLMNLPPKVLTLATFVASWPGMILALVAVPAAVTLLRRGPS